MASKKKPQRNYLRVIYFIGIAQLAGIIGSIFTAPAISTWYENLAKPTFSPPNWVFGPVWVTLYTLMGIGAYYIWKAKIDYTQSKRAAFVFFYAQIILNSIWSIVFFGLKRMDLAFYIILLLLVLIIYMIYQFYLINKKAAILQIPYIIWVTFATFLSFSIWYLNA